MLIGEGYMYTAFSVLLGSFRNATSFVCLKCRICPTSRVGIIASLVDRALALPRVCDFRLRIIYELASDAEKEGGCLGKGSWCCPRWYSI